MKESLTRKCACCGDTLQITKHAIGEMIYCDKKTYHKDCFANLCKEKMQSKRKDTVEKYTKLFNNIDELSAETVKYFRPMINKDLVYRFIVKQYNPTNIPYYVWNKLDDIYSGTYKDMTRGIPPEHLLDMWKRQMAALDKMHNKMEHEGKYLDPIQKINYDLAVLIGKYDSYLNWIEKQRIIEVERIKNNYDTTSIRPIVDKNVVKSNENKSGDTFDFDDLVDDIFN